MRWIDRLKAFFGVALRDARRSCEVIEIELDLAAAERVLNELQSGDREDHLGPVAELGRKSRGAIKAGRYDEAWRLLHEQKLLYMKHAKRYGHTPRQALALDGSVSASLANILRLEGKYDEALVHMLYSVANRDGPLSESMKKKVLEYFNRCRFENLTFDQALAQISAPGELVQLPELQAKVSDWRNAV